MGFGLRFGSIGDLSVKLEITISPHEIVGVSLRFGSIGDLSVVHFQIEGLWLSEILLY